MMFNAPLTREHHLSPLKIEPAHIQQIANCARSKIAQSVDAGGEQSPTTCSVTFCEFMLRKIKRAALCDCWFSHLELPRFLFSCDRNCNAETEISEFCRGGYSPCSRHATWAPSVIPVENYCDAVASCSA